MSGKAQHLKYLAVGPNDLFWGLAVNSVGSQEVGEGEPYPPGNHPTRYLFSEQCGRILDEYQMLYITEGSGRFKSASLQQTVAIEKGDVFLLFPGEWHSYRSDENTGWKEYWIGFNGAQIDAWVQSGFFSKAKPVWKVGLHSEMAALYEEAIEAASRQESGFQQRLGGIVAHLLGLAWSYGRNTSMGEVAQQMNQAKILISEEFRTIGPEEVATRLCMGYSKFRRVFREYTGISPARYIHQIRIDRAKEWLTNTSRAIKQIAFDAGYDNDEYFFTAFKRATGMTPQQYRYFTQGRSSRK